MFGAEKPLFEETKIPSAETTNAPTKKPLYRQKKLWIGLIIGLLVLFASLLFFVSRQRNNETPEKPQETGAAAQSKTKGPLEARIYALENELKSADPANQLLPFPPVDLRLSLE